MGRFKIEISQGSGGLGIKTAASVQRSEHLQFESQEEFCIEKKIGSRGWKLKEEVVK
jgi:hypothetical protein